MDRKIEFSAENSAEFCREFCRKNSFYNKLKDKEYFENVKIDRDTVVITPKVHGPFEVILA